MSMNPRQTTDKIRGDYQNYIASILTVKDDQITELSHKAVKNTEFVKGPYLESTLPFVDGKSLKELADENLISKEFGKMGKAVHFCDWKLRIHQERALRHIIENNRNMVVSTGTGSGKTECYLYPIFNSIMREKEAGTLSAGVRALLIFPMNALANDQQKKLRKLLKEYPDITFGRYTGETERKRPKETPEEAERRLHEEYDNAHLGDTEEVYRKSIPNELMSREMMAKEPPHILLTNYAMLEYMLLRPDTAPFFDNQSAENWRFIVIDEAHTYKGATGAEIAYLLRRVKERIRHNMTGDFRCIATSATLGSEDGKPGLAKFAENLFGEPFSAEDIITTERKKRVVPPDARDFMPDEYKALKKHVENMEENEKGKYLYNSLVKDNRLFKVYEVLRNKPKKIEEVASVVFDDLSSEKERENALIDLIELAAAAKKSEDESALLPARYHLFIKSLEGLFAQYYPAKKVYLDRKERVFIKDKSYAVFELANCQKCTQEYLIGKTKAKPDGQYFVHNSSDEKPEYYFISSGDENIDLTGLDEDDSIEGVDKMNKLEKYHLCLCCGRITSFSEKHPEECCGNSDPDRIATVYNLKYAGKNNESNCCPCCGATQKGLIKRFLTANQPATFAVAKSLYDAIPPRPVEHHKSEDLSSDDIFIDDFFDDPDDGPDSSISEALADESGRKLLIFSDNRQEAAFFAGFFEKKYNLIMWRKLILQCLQEADGKTLSVPDLIKKVRDAAEKAGIYTIDQERNANLTDNQKIELASLYVMQEFMTPDIQTGLEGLGYVQIAPEYMNIQDSAELAGLKGKEVWNLLRFLMDTLRQKGAISYPEGVYATNDFFAPRNHKGYFRQSVTNIERGEYVYGFIPEAGRSNKRLSIMMKLLEDTTDEEKRNELARENLNKAYKLLLQLVSRKYIISTVDQAKGTVYLLNYAKWNFHYVENKDTLYRCDKCGKTFGYSVRDLCPEMKCNGKLRAVKASEIQDEPYYSNLYADNKIIPMVSREHTAQLAAKTAGEYQKNFEQGIINVLSCSTTFEMGVDVGELEATFQRNVPPETANYIQRAGRAGRRTSSAAFSVTFSRRSSHDMTFFHDPAQIIAGKIAPPILEIDNDKIAERHLNSIVVSWFFKKHPEFFLEKTRKIVSYKEPENMGTVMKEELSTHPQELLDSIHNIIPEDICQSLRVDEWAFINDLVGDEGSLTRAIEERTADIDGLKTFSVDVRTKIDEGSAIKGLGRAIAAEKLITTLEDEASISFLSAKGVLPKYGFPIDTVSLDIIGGSDEEAKKIDLSRDLKMAISEFAPPAKIVANGKVWESYAINTIPNKGWPAYIYHECPKCKKIFHPEGNVVDITVNLNDAPKKVCEYCNTLTDARLFIIPLFGFSTQMEYKPKPVGEVRPSTYYATQTQFWGIEGLTEKQKAEAQEKTIDIKGKDVKVTYSPGGKLFVLNQGIDRRGLLICPTCGYAKDPTTKDFKHDNKYKKACGTKKFIKASLGNEFSTDILKIALPNLDSHLPIIEGAEDKDLYMSVLYAILEGASMALDISRSDISGCVTENREIVLFDDTAGGSGFVKSIYYNFYDVLRAAKNKVSGQCGCTPETSCYGCLRNYSNQFFHDQLSRGLAENYLDCLLNYEVETKKPVESREKNEPINETVGSKTFDFDLPDTSSYSDVKTQLISMRDSADDAAVKAGYNKLIEAVSDNNYEKCVSEERLPAKEKDVWPELFWARSHVALFVPEKKKQYDILKKYDWYCYIVDENINAELVISHLKEE
ncbi:MAG: DEAD/DEAH box helicase [Clostridiales bacterium]|nr:DEAD/DEAH box helicase [Clostridiales bacterium]